jgi:dTDP-4-amino-4,6-dideoxygalactose transaminase
MTSQVPLSDLSPEIHALRGDILAAIERVIRSGRFILDREVAAFERELTDYLGVVHGIGVNSGTDALTIGLRAIGVGPGDEVITSPFTFFATAEAISAIGAVPVFVDIESDTLNLDPRLAARAVTSRTKGILPVHIFGHPADMSAISVQADKHGLAVLEDAAQALGASVEGTPVGALGDAAALSFFPSKNLGAFGDGGLLVTNDDGVAETARMLRAHGRRENGGNELVGYNSRLDELQAAVLRVKLPHIDEANEGRRRIARAYAAALADVAGVTCPAERPGAKHVFHQYTIRVAVDRDAVAQRLSDSGIRTAVYYRVPLHRLPVYEGLGYRLPVAERVAGEVLSLPIWPTMPNATVKRVADAVRFALR